MVDALNQESQKPSKVGRPCALSPQAQVLVALEYWRETAPISTSPQIGKSQNQPSGYWLIAIDRTEWKARNVFMVSLVWGRHALPIY